MKKLFLFLILTLTGCGVSPVLHHQNADAQSSTNERSTVESACPLSLPEHHLCAELTWDSAPNDQDAASFVLRFWNPKQGTRALGPFIDPSAPPNVLIWMPAMGHGSAPITLKHAQDLTGENIPGIYLGSAVYFLMPGAWEVHVQIKDATNEEAIEPIQI